MTFKRSPRRKVWLYPRMPKLSVEGEYDAVLGPQLYLVHRVDFPIRFAHQARKIAPSIMEEFGAKSDWIFEVYQDNEGWIFLAYDPRQILSQFEAASLNPRKVKRLFFAQQFAEYFSHPVRLGERDVLANVRGTVTVLPAEFIDEAADEEERLSTLPEPAKSFPFRALEESRSKWKIRDLVLLTLAALLFAGAWIVEGIRAHSERVRLERELQESAHGDPTLISSITRRNIYERYALIDHRQRNIRQILKRLGKLVSKESKLTSVQISPEGYNAVFDVKSDKIPALKQLALSYELHPIVQGDRLIVKGRWK
ncbi:hypothetical protein [Nitratifractor sp.]